MISSQAILIWKSAFRNSKRANFCAQLRVVGVQDTKVKDAFLHNTVHRLDFTEFIFLESKQHILNVE